MQRAAGLVGLARDVGKARRLLGARNDLEHRHGLADGPVCGPACCTSLMAAASAELRSRQSAMLAALLTLRQS